MDLPDGGSRLKGGVCRLAPLDGRSLGSMQPLQGCSSVVASTIFRFSIAMAVGCPAPSTEAKSLDPGARAWAMQPAPPICSVAKEFATPWNSADVLADCLLAEVSLEEYQHKLAGVSVGVGGSPTAWHAEPGGGLITKKPISGWSD